MNKYHVLVAMWIAVGCACLGDGGFGFAAGLGAWMLTMSIL